jgi:hypothetical protein
MDCEACAEEIIEPRHKKIELLNGTFHEHCVNYGVLAVWAASECVREDLILSNFYRVFFRLLEEAPLFFWSQHLRILAAFTTSAVSIVERLAAVEAA